MNRVGSVASLTPAFFIIQYFLINEGISVTSCEPVWPSGKVLGW